MMDKHFFQTGRSDMVFAKMSTRITLWLIWLLMWHASGSHAQQCSQVAGQAAPSPNGLGCQGTQQATHAATGSCHQSHGTQSQGTCGNQATTRTVQTQPGLATVSLHEYVYKNDFAGFRAKMKLLDHKENLPVLIGALQSVDDKGMTIAHLLACAGRADELFLVTQAVNKIQEGLAPLQARVLGRAALEHLSLNASCTSCRSDRAQQEVVPHLRLELTNPRQTIFLYGNVTPLECAAAHGHVEAMKMLMQRGVSGGRSLTVAQQLGLENQLFEATNQARAEGGLGVMLAHDLPDKPEAPMRKPRQRRTEPKSKGKGKSKSSASSNTSASATRKAAAAAAAAASAQKQQQQQGKCGAQTQSPLLKVSPVGVDVRPGAKSSSFGSVASSLLSVRGKENADPTKPVSTPSQLSEVMDVTALWLLSIMLFFPAWSTFCLVWRKMIKRRWALQESVTRVRRAVSAVSQPFKRDSSATTAAAATAAAAAATTSGPQRSAGSGSEVKGGKVPAASGGATPRQQRKAGPSIVLPGAVHDPRLSAVKAASPTGGSLFRAISAPEASIRAQLNSLSKQAPDSDNSSSSSPSAAAVRRQASSMAAAVAASADVAPVASRLSRAPVTAVLSGPPAVQQPGGSAAAAGAQAMPATAPVGPTAANNSRQHGGATAASSSSSTGATSAPSSKQKRAGKNASAASGAAATPAPVTDSSKASQGSKASAAASGETSAEDSNKSSSGAAAALSKPIKVQPTVLFKAKPASAGFAGPSAAAVGTAASQPTTSHKDSPRAVNISKSGRDSDTSDTAAGSGPNAFEAAGGASTKTQGTKGASTTAQGQVRSRLSSALSAALQPSVDTTSTSGAAAAGEQEVGSTPSSRPYHTLSVGCDSTAVSSQPTSRSDDPTVQQAAVSPLAAAGTSGGSSRLVRSPTTPSTGAGHNGAAAGTSLRRTASGGVMISRSPNKELDDILTHCRDQDRPQGGPGGAAAAGIASRDLASSAPAGNAWTPAAAAARAARAAELGKPRGSDASGMVSSAAAGAEEPSPGEASSEACSHHSATLEGVYAPSLAAAAIAAGILPTAIDEVPEEPDDAVEPAAAAAEPSTRAQHLLVSTGNAAAEAEADAKAAARAAGTADLADSCDSDYGPELDPPLALLPSSLLSCLDGAPGRSGSGGLPRCSSALEPKVLHDLADLVAASIAQEVQARSSKSGAAAEGGAAGGSNSSPDKPGWQEGRASDPGSKSPGDTVQAIAARLTDVMGPQLVHQSLGDVLAQLTTGATTSSVTAKAAASSTSGGNSGLLQGLLQGSPRSAGPMAQHEVDSFSYTSATLFADLASKLQLPSRQSPNQQQPQALSQAPDVACSSAHVLRMDQAQQKVWFAAQQQQQQPPVSSMSSGLVAGGLPLQMDPPALICSRDPPVCSRLHAPTGPQGASGVAATDGLPAGVQLLQAPQGMTLLQRAPQQQQQMVQRQQPVQGMMVAMGPGQQPLQVVSVQPMSAARPAQGQQIIRLANGQLVQGQLVAVQGRQLSAMPVMNSTAASAAGGAVRGPVMMTPSGMISMQGHVHQAPPAQQPQLVPAHRVFYPPTMVQAGPNSSNSSGAQGMRVVAGPGGQQQQVMGAQHQAGGLVKLQGMPGKLLHSSNLQPAPAAVSSSFTSGFMQQGLQPKHTVTFSGAAAANSSSSNAVVSSPPRVTVLEAPAGPGATAAAAQDGKAGALSSPERLQVMLQDPQRHNETGVYVAWHTTSSTPSQSTPASKNTTTAANSQQMESTEREQMAAELDELLHQANQLVCWSSLPQDAAQDTATKAADATNGSKANVVSSPLDGLLLPDGFTSSE